VGRFAQKFVEPVEALLPVSPIGLLGAGEKRDLAESL